MVWHLLDQSVVFWLEDIRCHIMWTVETTLTVYRAKIQLGSAIGGLRIYLLQLWQFVLCSCCFNSLKKLKVRIQKTGVEITNDYYRIDCSPCFVRLESRVSDDDSKECVRPNDAKSVKWLLGLPFAIKTLMKNTVMMLTIVANAVDSFLLSGFSVFFPKFLQNQFLLSPTMASVLEG